VRLEQTGPLGRAAQHAHSTLGLPGELYTMRISTQHHIESNFGIFAAVLTHTAAKIPDSILLVLG